MNLIDFILVPTIAIFDTILIFFILFKNHKSTLYRSLAGVISFFTLWIVFAFVSELVLSHNAKLFLSRMTYASILLGVLFFIIFVFAFIRERQNRIVQISLSVLVIALCVVTATSNAVVKDIILTEQGFDIVFGPAYIIYLATTLLVLWGVAKLVRTFFRSHGQEREQIKFFLFGFLLFAFINIVINIIIRSIVDNDIYYRIGNYSIVFFTFFTSYAIVRHRFLNIRLIITRSLMYLVLTAMTAGFLIFLFLLLVQNIDIIGVNRYVILGVAAAVIVLVLDPLKQFLARMTDSIFYKDKIDYSAEMRRLSNRINEEIELSGLIENVTTALAKRLKLRSVSLLLAADEGKVYLPLEYYVQENFLDGNTDIYNNSPFIQYVCKFSETIVADELERQVYDTTDEHEKAVLSSVLSNLEELHAGLVVPVERGKKVTSLLVIGRKVSGEAFSNDDITLFEVLANQLAAALERSKLYQKVQTFNMKLQKEVDRQTAELQEKNVALGDANKRLKKLDQAKSEFMSIASHQLRTPLAGISGYLSMIQEGNFGPLNDELSDVVHSLSEASDRLSRLVNTLLSATQIEAGKFVLSFSKVDMAKIVRDEVHDLFPTAEQREVELAVEIDNEPLELDIDSDKMRDVVINLVDNAIKYTSPGGKVDVHLSQNEQQMHFFVKDTGKGIDPEEAKQLFKKFVRGHNIAEIHPNGSGLGLYIVKQIIEGHGGKVWAESEGKGKGTTFHVTIPIKKD